MLRPRVPRDDKMPSARGGPSPRTRVISPNKPTRKLEETPKVISFEDTLRGGDDMLIGSESLETAPDLEQQQQQQVDPKSDFLAESLRMDRILTIAGKKARTAFNSDGHNQLAKSRLEHAMMYSEINLLPKSKAEIYNQLLHIREERDRFREELKRIHKSTAKVSIMFKLECKKTKKLKQSDIENAKELRSLRSQRREANLLIKSTMSDFENFRRMKELEIVKLQQEKEVEKHKLQESLLLEQQNQAKNYESMLSNAGRTSESREAAHRKAIEVKAQEIAEQKAQLERSKVEMERKNKEMENKFLDKIKTVKTGFGSETSMLQKKLQAARGHLSNAREKAMSDKERIMSETHKKDIIELEKKHVLALAEKDLEIQKVEKHVARQMQRIKVLEMAIRNAKVEMVKEKLHDMDEEYDYLSRVGVPPMGIFEKGEVGY